MKTPILILTTFFLCISSCISQVVWTDKTRILPDDLRKVPVAILLTHSTNPNYPELNKVKPKKKGKYVWKHSTSITAVNKTLEIVKAGSFIWYSAEGWQRNAEYNKRDIANRFNCPKGILKKGVTYTYSRNYRYGNNTYGGDALWYVIAKDDDGNLYKGMGIIETESEVID
ncbi:MAG: hypothetical protein ACI9FN_003489 [Saprospiraceae bacterium]|jgi:hypothetical protein